MLDIPDIVPPLTEVTARERRQSTEVAGLRHACSVAEMVAEADDGMIRRHAGMTEWLDGWPEDCRSQR